MKKMKEIRLALWIALLVFTAGTVVPAHALQQRTVPAPAPLPPAQARPAPSAAVVPPSSARTGAGRQSAAPGKPQGKVQTRQNPEHPAMSGSPGHIFFVIPAYNVDYQHKFVPLTSHEKFLEWARGAYDPVGLGALAVESGLEYSHKDGFCGYGKGMGAYGKCYASAVADGNISSFFGDYLFAKWLHEDPRYFRLGERAGGGARVWYSLSRLFIARTDSGGWTFATAPIAGTVLAATASNLYYPRSERNFGHTMSRIGFDLGGTAIFNLEAEFWPDVQRFFRKVF